jgi:hypothetical protein
MKLKERILQLEKELLKSEVRKSSQKINEILSDDFIEFCSSGNIYCYKNGDIFQEKDDELENNWRILDFEIKELSDDCILALYKVIKLNEKNEKKRSSIRSSIWKLHYGKWKMIFHQGTNTRK